jgi:hypothetical protein
MPKQTPTRRHNGPHSQQAGPQWTVSGQTDRGAVGVRSAAYGLAGVLVGSIAGFNVGANVGGNWFTSFSMGSLRGYEGTAWKEPQKHCGRLGGPVRASRDV